MKYKNPKLYNAMKSYISEAVKLLKNHYDAGEPIPEVERDYWIKQAEGQFIRKSGYAPRWSISIHKLEKELMELPEHKALILELSKDKRITVQYNKLIGTSLLRSLFSEENLVNGVLIHVLNKAESLEFSRDIFEKEYLELEDFLYNSVVLCGVIAPLANFKTVIAPVQLENNLSIVRLKDEEIEMFLSMGIFPLDVHFTRTPQFALRLEYKHKKVVRGQDEEQDTNESEEANKKNIELVEQLDDVIHDLRIFKQGECSLVVNLRYYDNWLLKGSISWNPRDTRRQRFTKYSLSKNEADVFKKFWDKCQSKNVKKHKFIDVACKRFSYANERTRSEDRLVDLMISAEALFLSDSGNPKYRGELRYRLALRVGFFIGKDGKHRKEVFDHMKYAYDIRSSLVHGGKPKLPKGTDSLDKFVEATENILRTSIHKVIDLAAQSKLAENSLVEWDDLIIDK